ncbi:MAG: glycerophosphodiester phosphodiesterase [Bacteroidetes bacterium]|nr:glycerophosphodiester phosphodiesterase [Bacteroidota bacterium]
MKKSFLTCILLYLLLLAACNKDSFVQVPVFGAASTLKDALALQGPSRQLMEGVYEVIAGVDRFGETVVMKWNRNKVSVFCGNGRYMIMEAGYKDSAIMLEGYWRYSLNDNTGLVRFNISKEEGGSDLLAMKQNIQTIIMRGSIGDGVSNLPDKFITLQYMRPFSDTVKNGDFDIVAHRSGGRTSDHLPYSENSIPMISYTGYFGSTGIEIDVQLTKDGVPILYHDDDINIRLTRKGPVMGPVGDFTWNQLSAFVTLIHGEKIPKLEDALNFVIDSTEIKFVWLDMKSSSNSMSAVVPIQKRMMEKVNQAGRNLKIYIGLPASNVVDEFKQIAGYRDILSLCELTLDDVRDVNAKAWGPRWTRGILDGDVQAMHNEGRKAYCWTLDDISFIEEYSREGHFDGILTNYPSIVAYYHYIREN